MKQYVLVDFDGTLSIDTPGEVFDYLKTGEPVMRMVEIIRQHLAAGDDVKIFTARASTKDFHTIFNGTEEKYKVAVRKPIEEWCEKYLGQKLEITCEKTYQTTLIYDDRATSVERNTGNIKSWRKLG